MPRKDKRRFEIHHEENWEAEKNKKEKKKQKTLGDYSNKNH